MRSVSALLLCALAGVMLSGCAAIAVVDTVVGVATTVVGTTVDVAAGAVSTVAGSSEHDEEELDCEGDDKDADDCKNEAEKPD